MTVVGVMHPGAMGSAVGAALRAGGHEVLWAAEGRSDETAQRARRAGLSDAGTIAVLLEREQRRPGGDGIASLDLQQRELAGEGRRNAHVLTFDIAAVAARFRIAGTAMCRQPG